MPADALPVPWDTSLDGTVHYRREYRDILGRPMTGEATLTGQTRTERDGVVVSPAPVTVKIEAGVLEVDLPPDTYRVAAALRTRDGARVSDTDTITLTETA